MVFCLLPAQLLKRVGVVELLFTSDGQQALDNSLKLRPAQDVLITVNFMTNKNALEHLAQIQVYVGVVCVDVDVICTSHTQTYNYIPIASIGSRTFNRFHELSSCADNYGAWSSGGRDVLFSGHELLNCGLSFLQDEIISRRGLQSSRYGSTCCIASIGGMIFYVRRIHQLSLCCSCALYFTGDVKWCVIKSRV